MPKRPILPIKLNTMLGEVARPVIPIKLKVILRNLGPGEHIITQPAVATFGGPTLTTFTGGAIEHTITQPAVATFGGPALEIESGGAMVVIVTPAVATFSGPALEIEINDPPLFTENSAPGDYILIADPAEMDLNGSVVEEWNWFKGAGSLVPIGAGTIEFVANALNGLGGVRKLTGNHAALRDFTWNNIKNGAYPTSEVFIIKDISNTSATNRQPIYAYGTDVSHQMKSVYVRDGGSSSNIRAVTFGPLVDSGINPGDGAVYICACYNTGTELHLRVHGVPEGTPSSAILSLLNKAGFFIFTNPESSGSLNNQRTLNAGVLLELWSTNGCDLDWIEHVEGRLFHKYGGAAAIPLFDPSHRFYAAPPGMMAALPYNTPVFDEFDGQATPSSWARQAPFTPNGNPAYSYTVNQDEIHITGEVTGPNQHLTNTSKLVQCNRPHIIEARFRIESVSGAIRSFAINFQIKDEGGAGSSANINTNINCWTCNADLQSNGITKQMGFVDGDFNEIGTDKTVRFLELNRWFIMRVFVNIRANGTFADKFVTFRLYDIDNGLLVYEDEYDYTSFGWMPDYENDEMVRVGLNSHFTDWTVNNFKVYYADEVTLTEHTVTPAAASFSGPALTIESGSGENSIFGGPLPMLLTNAYSII